MAQNYPENLNRSAYPSITGRSGNIDMRKLNPVLAQRGEILKAYRERLVGDIKARGQISDLNSRFTRILQDLGNSSISRQEQLLAARQANHQRMVELYGNYFQQFGNVLNKEALDFLDKHSKIDAPTLTAIMAGYEHARASRAEQQLAVLDRQAKMAEAQFALEKQAADLQTQREANNALLQQQNLQNQIDTINAINKSQNQYINDVVNNVYGGRGAAGGRGVGAGVGGSSAAGSFQAPVTGATGVAGTTGVFDPNSEEFRAVQEQIADAQAQAEGQEGQQVRRDNERNLGRAAVATASALSLPMWPFSRNSLFQNVGGALERAGSTAARGYFSPAKVSELARATGEVNQAFADTRSLYQTQDTIIRDTERRVRNWYRGQIRAGNIPPNAMPNANAIRAEAMAYLNDFNITNQVGDTKLSQLNLRYQNNLRDINDTITRGKNALNIESALTAERQAANSVGRFSRSRLIGNAQRFGGKLLGKVLGPASLILEGANWVDEIGGGIVAAGKWGIDKVFGIGDGRTLGQYYNEGRNSILAAENQLFNFISRGRVNSFLEDVGVEQVVGRLRELGWGGQGSSFSENNFTINQIMQMKDQDEDSFYKAAEALYQYDPHLDPTTGRVGEEINISPLEFFNRAYSNSVYNRQAIIQQNKAAQNLQIADQQAAAQAAEQEEIASMIGSDVHPFLRAMMGHYTEMGRPAGYDFHLGHAIAFARDNYIPFVADMESGNKQGAIGAMTSTGTAKSRYQMMDETFRFLAKEMLNEDDKAGNRLLNINEREILREARDKDANFLDNNGYGYLLGFMTLLYPLKSSVSASKFGSGNPNITGQQMIVDMIQQFKDGGGMSPYLLSNMGAAYSGASFGRMGKKEYAKNQDRITALIQSKYGPDHIADGVFKPNMQIAELLGAQGVKWNPKYDPTIWRDNWVKENFEKNEKGDDLVPKSTYKPYEQWKIDNGLNQARQVGKPEQITMSQYIKKQHDKVDFDNLDPLVKKQLNAVAEELGQYGGSLQLNSGYRSQEYQDFLRKMHKEGRGKEFGIIREPAKRSKHTSKVAFDVQKDALDAFIAKTPELKQNYGDARGMMAAYGFDNNVKDDPVHFSLNEDFRKKNSQSSGWTLPPVASLPFMPVEYPEVVAEPTNQGIADPLDMSQFDTLVSDALQPTNVSYNPDYDIAMQQMNEYDQQQEQQGTIVGYDENGNPIYE